MKLSVEVQSLSELDAFAGLLAKRMQGGEVVELVGDVGAGKTTFTAALVKALGSADHVSSPTFTISNVYESDQFEVHHFDFYRLGDNDELIKHELAEVAADPSAVIIMEWANSVRNVLDRPSISIAIQTIGESARSFEITIPQEYSYIGGAV